MNIVQILIKKIPPVNSEVLPTGTLEKY